MIPILISILFALLFIRQVSITSERDQILQELAEQHVEALYVVTQLREDRVQLVDQLNEATAAQPRGVYVVPPNVIGEDDVDVRA